MIHGIHFFVSGSPKAQPRARSFAIQIAGKWTARAYNPSSAEAWKNRIAIVGKEHLPNRPLEGPMRLDLIFIFQRPCSHFRSGKYRGVLRADAPYWHSGKPDRDNLEKAVMDSMKILGFFRDDGQVCAGSIEKRYGDEPGCDITLVSLEQPGVRPQWRDDPYRVPEGGRATVESIQGSGPHPMQTAGRVARKTSGRGSSMANSIQFSWNT